MITAVITRPPTVTPQIRPTQNTNDYNNQSETTYCNTTHKTCKRSWAKKHVPYMWMDGLTDWGKTICPALLVQEA
jgi:hypothetical protein